MRFVEKSLLLQMLDQVWKEHLLALDHLRQGIGLRAYGQRDPLNEYKSEAFALFNAMLDELKERVTMMLARVEPAPEQPPMPPPPRPQMVESHPERDLGAGRRRGGFREPSGGSGSRRCRCAATRSTRTTRRPGATARAMRPARAARARSSSTATAARCSRRRGRRAWPPNRPLVFQCGRAMMPLTALSRARSFAAAWLRR